MSDAPTAKDLLSDPVVKAAFAAAWADSFPDSPTLRHEEGGYIYLNPTTKELTIRRTPPGSQGQLDMTSPPIVKGAFIVGVYHTHPNPASEFWMPDPSTDDYLLAEANGVPSFVIAEDEIYCIGPDRRFGGLSGSPTYPK